MVATHQMADSSKAKNFNFPRMISEFGGYVSSVDKTRIAENLLVGGSQNVYKKLSGTISVRPGQKRQGAADSTASPCSSEFVWETSWGVTYTLVIANSKLYVVYNKIWYVLLSSLTLTRYVFDKWWDNSLKKDDALFVNGTDNIYSWGGGYGTLQSATVNTIVLDRTIALSMLPTASGNVVVNGTTYNYTGSGGSTLTGVTPDPSGEANSSGVFEAVVTHTSKPAAGFAGDYIKVINNQAYIGSYTSRLCYISKNTDYTDFSIPTPRVNGSPELIVLDGNGKGIGVRQGNACLGYGTNGWSIISFTDVSNNNILTNVTKKTDKPVAILQAPYAHEFIDAVGDNLIYLSQDQQVREFGDFNNAFVSVYPSLSQEVATELSAETFTGGGLRCIGEFIYVTAPNSGKVYLRQERTRVDQNGTVVSEKLWHSPFVWNATRIDQISGVVVAFSNANPQIYQVWDTNQWYDDSPSDEHLPYSCIVAFGYRLLNRQGLSSFDKQYTEGYITPGTPLNLLMNYNYNGATNAVNAIINSVSQPAWVAQPTVASLGDSSMGEETLGNGGISGQDSLPKFRCINSLPIINMFEWQPIYYSEAVDAEWELLAISSNAEPELEQVPSFVINKNRN